jgi:hypothetical protein
MKKRLSKEAIFRLQHPKNREVRENVSLVLEVTVNTVLYHLRKNGWNNLLTTEAALLVIEEGLGLDRKVLLDSGEAVCEL